MGGVEIIKTLLAGCGALALLSVVGCVGLVGAGSYAIDQAVEEQRARDAYAASQGDDPSTYGEDPFSDYQKSDPENEWENKEGWD